MKQFYLKTLAVALFCMVNICVHAYEAEIDGIYYSFNTTKKTATVVTRSLMNAYSGSVSIPSSVVSNGDTYSVTSIGDYAFWRCSGLTSVTIGNNVTSIGESAFYYCSGLTSLTIGNSVTSIGESAFYECSGLPSLIIPNGVKSIGSFAFSECSSLTSVIIPNSVTSIDKWAFAGCSGLISLTIGNSVTSIDDGAFYNCSSLKQIAVEVENKKYDSRDNCNAIIETESNTLITGCKNTVIPNSVTSIGSYAFGGCSSLTTVTIPNSVTFIGKYAFQNCIGLTSVTISNCVTSIDKFAFSRCSELTSVTIPKSVTSIGDYAFAGCTGLQSIYSLIETPFALDKSVFQVYGDAPEVIYATVPLYVPQGRKNLYQQAEGWKLFQNIGEGNPLRIGITTADKTAPTAFYSVSGRQAAQSQKGLNIIRTADGRTMKIMRK